MSDEKQKMTFGIDRSLVDWYKTHIGDYDETASPMQSLTIVASNSSFVTVAAEFQLIRSPRKEVKL